jgi:hypothetical protein
MLGGDVQNEGFIGNHNHYSNMDFLRFSSGTKKAHEDRQKRRIYLFVWKFGRSPAWPGINGRLFQPA